MKELGKINQFLKNRNGNGNNNNNFNRNQYLLRNYIYRNINNQIENIHRNVINLEYNVKDENAENNLFGK